jgi:hypothetical protein
LTAQRRAPHLRARIASQVGSLVDRFRTQAHGDAPPFRKRALFEELEGRVLLSASPMVPEALLPSVDAQAPVQAQAPVAAPLTQWFVVDLDGATDVDYHGPVIVEDIDVPAFAAPEHLRGREAEIVQAMLDALAGFYADDHITFSLFAPPDGGVYSTIHVGGDGGEFSQWGEYLGLAQQIDTGNADPDDIGLVFSDRIDGVGLDAVAYGRLLAGYVGHEAGHLLGFDHLYDAPHADDPLAAVAYKPYTHAQIAQDVRADLLSDDNRDGQPDGEITIGGRSYRLHPKIFAALRDHPSAYFAGTVGPDGFPDLVTGQGIIHPEKTATWLTRILDMAWQAQSDASYTDVEKSQILAWSFGFLTHVAGDHWAHSLVNQFAEGVFPNVGDIIDPANPNNTRDLGNAIRHVLVESYLADATPGFDGNPDRTEVNFGGVRDVTDDSTPALPLSAPTRFIYETLMRAVPFDPTHAADTGAAVIRVDAANKAFLRTDGGSFITDKFEVGRRIEVSGFSVNDGTYVIASVEAGRIVVLEALNDAPADRDAAGDRRIVMPVAATGPIRIDIDVTERRFQRNDGGSFVVDGFKEGQRLSATGFGARDGDYTVIEVAATTLKVAESFTAGDGTGTGDERLDGLGSRGMALDFFLNLRSQLVKLNTPKPPEGLGVLISQAIDAVTEGRSLAPQFAIDLYHAYLDNWVKSIDQGLRHWPELGLYVSQAFFDPQARRDLQNKIGSRFSATDALPTVEADGTVVPGLRGDKENDVGLLDVIFDRLDDPNRDGKFNDSWINTYLMPMFGLPPELSLVRGILLAFGDALHRDVLAPLQVAFNPLAAIARPVKEFVSDLMKDFVRDRFGIDIELLEFLSSTSGKLDLATIKIDGKVIPVFKPGDRERMDAMLGLEATDHLPLPGSSETGRAPKFEATFYSGALGRLKDDATFDKNTFLAYANAVTMSKMLLLVENPVDGSTVGANGLTDLFTHQLQAITPSRTVPYDVDKLNVNGAHGGNIFTITLPGVNDGSPWLTTIDGDQVYRQDSQTTTAMLFRVGVGADAKAQWTTTVTPGRYQVQASWLVNVSREVPVPGSPVTQPDRTIRPAKNATYRIYDGTRLLREVTLDQNRYSADAEDGLIAFSNLGTFDVTGSSLRVELTNPNGTTSELVSGPIRLVPEVGGTPQTAMARRIQIDRDVETLAIRPSGYTEPLGTWLDMAYETGGGNFPLWESEILRPVFRRLFDDPLNPGFDFPALGDATSPDPTTTPSLVADPLPSHATTFSPVVPDQKLGIPITRAVKDLIVGGIRWIKTSLGSIGGQSGNATPGTPPAPPADAQRTALPPAPGGATAAALDVFNVPLPGIGKSLAQLVDLPGLIDRQYLQPIERFFATDTTPTIAELLALDIPGLRPLLDGATNAIEFELDLKKLFTVALPLDLGLDAGILLAAGAQTNVAVTVGFVDRDDVTLPKLVLGIDFAEGLEPDERFYLRADRATVDVRVNIADLDASARIGFLGAAVENGTLVLDASVSMLFNDPNGDGRITVAEICATPLTSLIAFTATGAMSAELPIRLAAGLGLAATVGTARIAATDVFDTATYSATFDSNLEAFADFRNMDAGTFVGLLGQLTGWLDEFQRSDAFTVDLPLVGDALRGALALSDLVRDTLLYDDRDTPVTSDDVAKLVDASNRATFSTVQELAQKLDQILGTQGALTYDPLRRSLLLTLSVSQAFVGVDAPFDFNVDLGGLAGLTGRGGLQVSADGAATLTLGIYVGDDGGMPLTETRLLSTLPGGADAFGRDLAIEAPAEIASDLGVLTADARFRILLDGIGGPAGVEVVVTSAATTGNRTIVDLVDDVQRAIDAAAVGSAAALRGKVAVSSLGRNLVFTTVGAATQFSLTSGAGDAAVTQLGLAPALTGTSADIKVTVRDSAVYFVSFDGLAADPTLGAVMRAIEDQTAGKVRVAFSGDGTRLRFTNDVGPDNGANFRIENTGGSLAATLLGILGADVSDPSDASQLRDYRFEGRALGGVALEDRLFIENASLTLDFDAQTPAGGVDIDGRFGFATVALDANGALEGQLSLALRDPDPTNPDGRITLRELMTGLTDITTLVGAPTLTGSGRVEFGVDVVPSLGLIQPGNAPKVIIDIADIGDPFAGRAPVVTTTTSGFGDLAAFEDIGFADILEALRALSGFLGQFESFGFLNEKIPLIDVSVNDMLAFADDFAAALDALERDPAGSLQSLETKIRQALGLPATSPALRLSLVRDGAERILRFDLEAGPQPFSKALPVGFALGDSFAVQGSANLLTNGSLDIDLSMGLDLSDPTRIFVFDATGIRGSIQAAAQDVDFAVGLGDPDGGPFVGGRIADGDLSLAGNFALGLGNAAMTGTGSDRRILLADLLATLGDSVSAGGAITVAGALPVYFPTASLYRGDIAIGGIATVSLEGFDVTGTVGPQGDAFIHVPDSILDFDFGSLSAVDNLLLIVDGVDGFLAILQDFLDGEVGGLQLPIIGDQLAQGATFIQDFRDEFIDGLRSVVSSSASPTANFVSQQLFTLLNDRLRILNDRNGDGLVDITDIGLTTNVDEAGVPLADLFMEWDLSLGGRLVDAGAGLDADIGLPALGLETRGDVRLTIDWDVDFGFGIGGGKGFYLDLSDPDELTLDVEVTLPGAGITGRLGPLQFDANDRGDTRLGVAIALDLHVGAGDARRVGLMDLGGVRLDGKIAADAIVDLAMALSLNSEVVPDAQTAFPKLSAGFFLEWKLGDRATRQFVPFSSLDGDALQKGLRVVKFDDIAIDLGSALSKYVRPIVVELRKLTEPIQPVIDVLVKPIPVISDLAGRPISLLDLAQRLPGNEESSWGLIRDLATLADMINRIPVEAGELKLSFGELRIYDSGGDANLQRRLTDATQKLADVFQLPVPTFDLDQALNGLANDNPDLRGVIDATRDLAAGGGESGKLFSVPFLENPTVLFGLLTGRRDIELVRIDPSRCASTGATTRSSRCSAHWP